MQVPGRNVLNFVRENDFRASATGPTPPDADEGPIARPRKRSYDPVAGPMATPAAPRPSPLPRSAADDPVESLRFE